MTITGELINGLSLGIEHVSPDEEEEFSYIIVVHLLVFRFCFIKLA